MRQPRLLERRHDPHLATAGILNDVATGDCACQEGLDQLKAVVGLGRETLDRLFKSLLAMVAR